MSMLCFHLYFESNLQAGLDEETFSTGSTHFGVKEIEVFETTDGTAFPPTPAF
jgi:hypothetical protein